MIFQKISNLSLNYLHFRSMADLEYVVWCKPTITVEDLQQFLHTNAQNLTDEDFYLINHCASKLSTLSPQFSLRYAELKIFLSNPVSKIVVFKSSKRVFNRYLAITRPESGPQFVIRDNDCFSSLSTLASSIKYIDWAWFWVWIVAIVLMLLSLYIIFRDLKLKVLFSGCLNAQVSLGLFSQNQC